MKKTLKMICVALMMGGLVVAFVGCNSPKSLAKQMYNVKVKIDKENADWQIEQKKPSNSFGSEGYMKAFEKHTEIMKKLNDQSKALDDKYDSINTPDADYTFRLEYKKLFNRDYPRM